MDRAEGAGLGVAIAGHAVLFRVLSMGLIVATKPVVPTTTPVDIQIVDEVGLRDMAREPAMIEPAQSVAPEIGPPEPVTPPPEPPPEPIARVEAAPPKVAPPKPATPARAPTPKPVRAKPVPPKAAPAKASSKPAAKPAPAETVPAKVARGSRLGSDFLNGVTDRPTASTAQAPRAPAGPAVEASLAREVLRQLKPHWKAPTGADAELLRTELSIALDRDGGVAEVRVLATKGVNDSNRTQARLHNEAAVKAVRLAAPFSLPPALYDAWKLLEPVGFDKRLSQ